jgi:hypothetical protein
MAAFEIGDTVAVPIVSAATASTIASDVFMSALLLFEALALTLLARGAS